MADLTNRAALVTGASRGIGQAIALKPASQDPRAFAHHSSGRVEAGAVFDETKASEGPADAASPDGVTQRLRRQRTTSAESRRPCTRIASQPSRTVLTASHRVQS